MIMDTGFRGLHPMLQFLYYIFMTILIMLFNHPFYLIICCIILIAINGIIEGWGKIIKRMKSILLLGSFIVVLNAIFVAEGATHLWTIWGMDIMLEPILFGIITTFMLMAILLLFATFNSTLNGQKFLYVFASFFQRTAFLTMLAMRFVPLLKSRLQEITDVQRIKGLSITSGKLRERIRSGMLFLQILLTWSLGEALDTADAMNARGYGIGKRSQYKPYLFEIRDGIKASILLGLFTCCIVGLFLGHGRITIYPEYKALPFTVADIIFFLCFTLLSAFPLMIEGGDELRWHYFK